MIIRTFSLKAGKEYLRFAQQQEQNVTPNLPLQQLLDWRKKVKDSRRIEDDS